jgi:hypothetical protein
MTSQMRNFLDQNRPAMDEARARWKGEVGIHEFCDPAWRTGIDDSHDDSYALACFATLSGTL